MHSDHPVTDSAFVLRHLGLRLAEGGKLGDIIGELRGVCAPTLTPLLDRLEQGQRQGGLAGALAAAPELFGHAVVPLVTQAELAGGNPAPLLAAYTERLARMSGGLRVVQETLISFGSYFAVLLLLGMLIYNLLVFFVAPAFEMLFGSLGDQLPPITRLYLALGNWLWLFDLLLLALLAQLFIGGRHLRRTLRLGGELEGWIWHLPSLRAIAQLQRTNTLLHTMQLLEQSGVGQPQLLAQGAALATLAPATHAELQAAALLGRLPAELEWQCRHRDADFEREVRSRTRRLSIALYLAIALFFGGMVIAFYAPLFSIASAI